MMHIGFRTNRNLPQVPMYLDLQPADHNRIIYSTPKNTTRQISCNYIKLINISTSYLRGENKIFNYVSERNKSKKVF